ncbi:MAG: class I SAM-dependent methyltransferase, partial [Candidatus Levybacteria bacterium]|nr:class I SAM-dependent methyltransferase [Candidatus Levybacteria bacterium]
LEHLDKPQEALRELKRVSKKYLVLSVPNEPFFMISRLLKGLDILKLGNHPGHLNHWTFLSFKNFVGGQGLKIRKLSLPFPWTIILAEKI